MSKQLSPIGSLLEWAKRAQKLNRDTGVGNSATFTALILKLEKALPEEKQFAEDAFNRGKLYSSKWPKTSSFSKYYKKYEDEDKDKA
jgi:hypothetical protein